MCVLYVALLLHKHMLELLQQQNVDSHSQKLHIDHFTDYFHLDVLFRFQYRQWQQIHRDETVQDEIQLGYLFQQLNFPLSYSTTYN